MPPQGRVHLRDAHFDFHKKSEQQVTKDILGHPRVIHVADTTATALVIALKDELLVHPSHQNKAALMAAAKHVPDARLGVGGAYGKMAHGTDIQVWRLTPDSLKHGRALHWSRALREPITAGKLQLMTVTPNHVAVVSHWDTCPSGKPTFHKMMPHGWLHPFPETEQPVQVAVIDTGYIPLNTTLDARIVAKDPGQWLDKNDVWQLSGPDLADADGNHKLDDIAGHGTFACGLIAHRAPEAAITIVSHRHEALHVPPQVPLDKKRLFTSELAVAASLLRHRDKDVILCQFAFPTLDGYPSLAAWGALANIPDHPAIVAPAGNEDTSAPYWPAAFDRVKGVGSSTGDGAAALRATFSNWGHWVDCCANGQGVVSTYLRWPDEFSSPPPTFDGWAIWSGTCFAAAKVAGAIAKAWIPNTGGFKPVDAYETLGIDPGTGLHTELKANGIRVRQFDLG